MKVTFIPNVISALGTVTKGLIQGLEELEIIGRVETIRTRALFRLTRILRRNSSERPSANANVKNSQRAKKKKKKKKNAETRVNYTDFAKCFFYTINLF